MKRISILLVTLIMVFGLSVQGHATLIVRGTDTLGNQLIYDTNLNITWYDYTNSPTGAPNSWLEQMNWADTLTVDFGGIIYADWRLPTALNQDGSGPIPGYLAGSEMGHLYYTELGNLAGGGLINTGDFQNLHSIGGSYWTGTVNAPFEAWIFWFDIGYLDHFLQTYPPHYGFAVRDGDIAAVPEPATMLLLGSGLIGLVGYGRKRFFKK